MPTTQGDLTPRQRAAITTPGEPESESVKNLSRTLTALLADVFTLYMNTRNFHWHLREPYFSHYRLLLYEQAGQLFAMADNVFEELRKIDDAAIRSADYPARGQCLSEENPDNVDPADVLAELCEDNRALLAAVREIMTCAIATTDLLETWTDEAERHKWLSTESLTS